MRSQPGIQMRTDDPGAAVLCACGAELVNLSRGEGVYAVGTLIRQLGETTIRKGTCKECHAAYTIPVTTMPPDSL